jgi:hypothetical protein
MTEFLYQSNPWMLPVLMLIVLILAIELPYRFRALLAAKKVNTDPINALQAGLLTLSAFVLGLSFSQASARYDARRAIVVSEANAIGTTWLRANQLPPPKSKQFREILTDDTAARLAAYESPYDPERIRRTTDRADRDQDELWSIASSALSTGETKLGRSLLVQSLNETIDIIAEQRQALASHVPTAIVVLTLCLVTLGALSLGIRFALGGARPLTLSIIYVVAYVIVIEMMIDYDRPNSGFVTVSLTPMTEQLRSMRP